MNKHNITARIENAGAQDCGSFWAIWGHIYDDPKGRFPDGTAFHTSAVISLEGNILRTHNRIYRIDSWDSPEAEAKARKLAARPPENSDVTENYRLL